jgi:hypothetical protein
VQDFDLPSGIELNPSDLFDVLVGQCHQPFFAEPSAGVSWSVAVVFRGSVFAIEEFEGRVRLRTSSFAEDIELIASALARLLGDLAVLAERPTQMH